MNIHDSISEWEEWMTNQVVNTILLDFSLTFFLRKEDEECALKIEAPFKISNANEDKVLNPSKPPDMANILSLLGERLILVQINEEGKIVVEFSSGERIVVEPDIQYESWQISDRTSKAAVICMPGGGLG